LPLTDVFVQVIPIRIHDARWRFGTYGLIATALLIPLFGTWLALAVAAYFDHRRFQRVLAVLSIVAAVIIVGLLGIFALDALQVRSEVRAPIQFAFNVASVVATLKSIVAVVGLIVIGIAGFRGPKPTSNAKPASGGLVMGSKSGPGGTTRTSPRTPSSTPTQ
jgi:chromate transport protein ChrA